ncbi:MAG: cation:proton antiporter [Methanomassiliicoccales archaeon]
MRHNLLVSVEIYIIFLALSTAIFIGFTSNYLFRRFKAPDVLILIGLGYLFGPGMLGVVDETATTNLGTITPFVAAMALAIIMFDAGLDLHFRDTVFAFPKASIFTLSAFICSVFVTAVVASTSMGWSLLEGMLLGAIVGGTSGAIVIPLISHLKVAKETRIMVTLEAALTDVLVVAVASALLVVLGTGNGDIASTLSSLLSSFLVSSAIGFVAGLAWLRLLSLLARQPFSYMITLAALLLVFSLTELLPIGDGGGSIAALVFGLVIGNHEYLERKLALKKGRFSCDEEIKGFHTQITFFVRTFFFVYLGIVVSVMDLGWIDILLAVTIFSSLMLMRWLVTFISDPRGKRNRWDRLALFFMMPRGLAAAVMASVLASAPVMSREVSDYILGSTTMIILITTAFASLGTFFIEYSQRRSSREAKEFGINKK